MKLSTLNIFIILLLSLAFCSCVASVRYDSFHEGFHESTSERNTTGSSIGIPKHMIPAGDQDMYILKSQIVPPVCPACPSSCPPAPAPKPVTPCPPCGRCPEPSFECKKVPNYAAAKKNNVVPRAVLSDFSSFGM